MVFSNILHVIYFSSSLPNLFHINETMALQIKQEVCHLHYI